MLKTHTGNPIMTVEGVHPGGKAYACGKSVVLVDRAIGLHPRGKDLQMRRMLARAWRRETREMLKQLDDRLAEVGREMDDELCAKGGCPC